jgi:hypothetical protein
MSTADQSSTPPFKSSISDIALPAEGFRSNIPPHLLEGCDDATKWIMQEMSKATQINEFVLHATLEHNKHLKALNGKTYKNERAMAEAKEKLDELNVKAAIAEPFLKPMAQFVSLWEYRVFRWGVYITLFFLITYALPFYIAHPISLSNLWAILFGL